MEKTTTTPRGEWFHDWFDENYELVYENRTDAEAEDFVSHWPVDWKELAGRRALDIGCGRGRFCRALASRGVKTVGIDLSREQLKLAGMKSAHDNPIRLIRADMRRLPLKNEFGLITSLFTSFGYFETDGEHKRVLLDFVCLLSRSGIIVIDLPNPEFVIREVKTTPVTVKQVNGVRIVESRKLTAENSRVEKEIVLTAKDQKSYYHESVRLFSAAELQMMTAAAGLAQTAPYWGDYSGNEMSPTSPRMVFFGKRNG